MNRNNIEPGVLQTFRRFIVVIFALLSLGMCDTLDNTTLDYFTVLSWGHTGLLLIYLYRRGIYNTLGRYFLPVALVYVSTMPIFALYIATFLNLASGFPPEFALIDPGILYLWLILPLLLISTQYRMRVMLIFTFGTALLSIALALPLTWIGDVPFRLTWDTTFLRVLIFLIVGYVIVRITQAGREQRVTLAKKNDELAHYATTLEQLAITRERNRMARELHDTLAHTLSAVNIQLKALDVLIDSDPQAAKATLQQTHQLTRDGLHEARRALHALRSTSLDELGCVLAIQQTATAKAERAGIDLHLDLPVQITNVGALVEQNLYRIVDEAVNNVIHHADATRMKIAIYQTPQTLELSISDNGKGFDVTKSEQNGHYGILGMKERALLVNGDLNISSQSGQGTDIRLTIEN
ncbi:MAG: sensor histidine kinase [Aggregatilineales bacterium]